MLKKIDLTSPGQKILAGFIAAGVVFGLFKLLLNTVPTSDRTKDNVNRVFDVNNI